MLHAIAMSPVAGNSGAVHSIVTTQYGAAAKAAVDNCRLHNSMAKQYGNGPFSKESEYPKNCQQAVTNAINSERDATRRAVNAWVKKSQDNLTKSLSGMFNTKVKVPFHL